MTFARVGEGDHEPQSRAGPLEVPQAFGDDARHWNLVVMRKGNASQLTHLRLRQAVTCAERVT